MSPRKTAAKQRRELISQPYGGALNRGGTFGCRRIEQHFVHAANPSQVMLTASSIWAAEKVFRQSCRVHERGVSPARSTE